MIKRDFSVWDFVKQEPKKDTIDITGGTLISDYIVGSGDWTTTTTAIGGNNINNTVFVQNLSVAGTTDIPPQTGQMRTEIDEDGYWSTQVYIPEREWVTISRTESMVTAGETFVPTQRVSILTKFKNLFKKRA